MQPVSLKDLLEAGCHFGHKVDRWHPKAASFIYGPREGIHVIDLVKTKAGLEAAAKQVYTLASQGKTVLFLGTKRQASAVIKEEASTVGAPYFSKRWVGGFLSNWPEVHKNLEKIRRLTDEQNNGAWNKFPKHERVKLARYLNKLNMLYGGVSHLKTPPEAVFVVDIKTELVAVKEAQKVGATVIGIVDTNSNPSGINYVIPSNDDAVGAIKLLVHYIAKAYLEGCEVYEKEAAAKAEALAKEAAKKAEEAKEAMKKAAEKLPAKASTPAVNKPAGAKPDAKKVEDVKAKDVKTEEKKVEAKKEEPKKTKEEKKK